MPESLWFLALLVLIYRDPEVLEDPGHYQLMTVPSNCGGNAGTSQEAFLYGLQAGNLASQSP